MKKIRVTTSINAPVAQIWEYWNGPTHILKWAFASSDWEVPFAENDLKVGGAFTTRMAAKDKSASFDFKGVYTVVEPYKQINYTIEDGRTVAVTFEKIDDATTRVTEEFELESVNSEELQRGGWQAILENFKKYVENN